MNKKSHNITRCKKFIKIKHTTQSICVYAPYECNPILLLVDLDVSFEWNWMNVCISYGELEFW